jgi:PAS domain S-box-containing protein
MNSDDAADGLTEAMELEPHEHTLQGIVKGTPGYLSPEAAAGRIDLIGPRTDVYGLGAILYEILAGRPPFIATTVRDGLAQVVSAEPLRPTALVPDVPTELEASCLRALAKNPEDRQATASELAAQVQHWLADSADRGRARLERERFFNLSLDLLCTIDSGGCFKQLNPAWETTLGWTRDELIACSCREFLHADDLGAMLAEVAATASGAIRPAFENRFRHKEGSYRWVSWTASLIAGEQLVYAVGRDVTERKNAEVALRRSQERFELAVRGSGDGLWDWDRETGESYYSPRWKSMIGYEDHEIAHDISEWETRLHPDDRERALAALRLCTEGGEPAYEVEYRLRHKDGSYRWILDRGVAVRNATGVSRMAGSHTDITERKRMEQELRQGEVRHQTELAQCRGERT